MSNCDAPATILEKMLPMLAITVPLMSLAAP